MKNNLHPQWNNECQVTCVCGATFTTGSTQDSLQVEICSKCHPFFTGEMKFVDTQGRVDKFMKKREASAAKRAALEAAQAEKRRQNANQNTQAAEQLSYRQVLAQTQGQMQKDKTAHESSSTSDRPAQSSDRS